MSTFMIILLFILLPIYFIVATVLFFLGCLDPEGRIFSKIHLILLWPLYAPKFIFNFFTE